MCDSVLLMSGEIRCESLLGVKGLNRFTARSSLWESWEKTELTKGMFVVSDRS